MQNKLVIVFMIIFLVGVFLPSHLVKADEGGDLPPDTRFDFTNAPFPGTYGDMTEYAWEQFLQRAEELGHHTINVVEGMTYYYENGESESLFPDEPYYYSTDGTDVEEEYNLVSINYERMRYQWNYRLKFTDLERVNHINKYGHRKSPNDNDARIYSYGGSWTIDEDKGIVINGDIFTRNWYTADLIEDPYQEKPPLYNIDPERGHGMYFEKPEYGDWINVPHKLGKWHDEIKIRVQIPREIETDGGVKETYTTVGNWDLMADLNIAIRITNRNVIGYQQYADKVLGSGDSWILPGKMEVINFVENGEGVQLYATLPMDYQQPEHGTVCLLVAELYVMEDSGWEVEDFWLVDNATTWTKYRVYYGTVDEDGDGFDDRTGLPVNQPTPDDDTTSDKPDINDYDDDILGRLSYYFDSFIYYITMPFNFIGDIFRNILNWILDTVDGWINSFVRVFEVLFNFLPKEIVMMLGLGFATLMIITIIKAIRG